MHEDEADAYESACCISSPKPFGLRICVCVWNGDGGGEGMRRDEWRGDAGGIEAQGVPQGDRARAGR